MLLGRIVAFRSACTAGTQSAKSCQLTLITIWLIVTGAAGAAVAERIAAPAPLRQAENSHFS